MGVRLLKCRDTLTIVVQYLRHPVPKCWESRDTNHSTLKPIKSILKSYLCFSIFNMKKSIGRLFFKLMGWKFDFSLPLKDIPKCVLVAAPHTSNWDFFYAIFAFWYLEIPMRFFIKDSYTKPWYGFIFRKLGAIGIDRSQRKNMVDFGAETLINSKHLYMLNTPEGTRARVDKWKIGFYFMAEKAQVPILLAYCDYEKKISGIGRIVGIKNRSREDVLTEIEEYYKDIKGKYPENYNPKIF